MHILFILTIFKHVHCDKEIFHIPMTIFHIAMTVTINTNLMNLSPTVLHMPINTHIYTFVYNGVNLPSINSFLTR